MTLAFQISQPDSQLPEVVTATEVKNRFGAVLKSTINKQREVIISNHGQAEAVILPFSEWKKFDDYRKELKEKAERQKALDEFMALRAQVRANNQDLTEQQAEALAVRFSKDLIAAVVEKRVKQYG